jgi:hypothetical protein
MKTIFIFLSCLISFKSVTAQQAVETEILNYKGANNIIIPNIRELIMHKIDSGNIEAAKAIYQYTITVVEPKENLVFYNYEKVLLAYLLNDYTYILQRISDLQTGIITPKNLYNEWNKTYNGRPDKDDLWRKLETKLKNNLSNIDAAIEKYYQHDPEKIEVLKMYIRFFMSQEDHIECTATAINQRVKAFKKAYSNSVYSKYVKQIVEKTLSPKHFRYGSEINFGLVVPKGNIATLRKTDINFSGVLNLNYKKWLLQIGYQFNGFTLKKDLPVKNETWVKDSSIEHHQFSTTLGYMLIDTKRVGIYPTIGESISFINHESNAATQSKHNRIYSTLAPTFGIKFLYKYYVQSHSTRKGGDGFSYTAFNIQYCNNNFKNVTALNGGNVYFSISLLAHIAERSLLFPQLWGSTGNRHSLW